MAREVWLRSNRRFWIALAVAPAAVFFAAAVTMMFVQSRATLWLLALVMAASTVAVLWFAGLSRKPRLAYSQGMLEVHLTRPPLEVPIEIVECFFVGQGPSLLPAVKKGESRATMETATLIVRLAESALDWKHRDVRPQLGQWCEGYITIRGTFCEPLSKEVAGRLNRRLVEVHREVSQHKLLESV